jgi:hypothetical protein
VLGCVQAGLHCTKDKSASHIPRSRGDLGVLNLRFVGWAVQQGELTDAHTQHHVQSTRHQTTQAYEHPVRATQPQQHSGPKNALLR